MRNPKRLRRHFHPAHQKIPIHQAAEVKGSGAKRHPKDSPRAQLRQFEFVVIVSDDLVADSIGIPCLFHITCYLFLVMLVVVLVTSRDRGILPGKLAFTLAECKVSDEKFRLTLGGSKLTL